MSRSLRSRLLVGSILWTAGLLFVAHLTLMGSVHHALAGGSLAHAPLSFRGATGVFTALALLCMTAGFVQVRRGLRALDEVQSRLQAVREGLQPRLHGSFPAEVEPLVRDLNALLDHREAGVRQALAKAGDLAHGLKTPLAVLDQEAEQAAVAGHDALAATLRQQVERMRRHVEYHLAHARAAGAGDRLGSHSDVRETAEALARTVSRLYADRGTHVEVEVPPGQRVRVQREDLEEMLGNLLDNACKWARSRVVVRSTGGERQVVVTIDDDGPGLAPDLREKVLQRGVRADEAAPGSGLGLAIVREVAELYGGSVTLEAAPGGGLRARLTLPASTAENGNPR